MLRRFCVTTPQSQCKASAARGQLPIKFLPHTPGRRPLFDQSDALLAGGRKRGGGVCCDGVERDASVVCRLPVAARHPGVEEDLLQGRPVGRLLTQTPANQLLALCDGNTRR